MRAAYDETQRIVQEESYARMNERMWKDKQGQLVDIWVWWRRAIRNSPKRLKTLRLVERKPSGMGRKAIQLRLEPAKGIPTAPALMDKWRSTRKQLKTQTHLCACLGRNGNVPLKNRGGDNRTENGGSNTSRENIFRVHSLVKDSLFTGYWLFWLFSHFSTSKPMEQEAIQRWSLCADECRVD